MRVAPPRRTLVATWLVAAAVFGTLMVLAKAAPGPLDDADPAYQRPGFLDAGDLPRPTPRLGDGPRPESAAVVFFDRPGGIASLCEALTAEPFAPQVDVDVVVATASAVEAPGAERCPPDVDVVADAGGDLARGFGLRRPRGGGAPVGYAIVDASGVVRYATLDPTVAARLDEVRTVLRALG